MITTTYRIATTQATSVSEDHRLTSSDQTGTTVAMTSDRVQEIVTTGMVRDEESVDGSISGSARVFAESVTAAVIVVLVLI